VLRWAVYEAGKTHARAAAPDYRVLRPGQGPLRRQARRASEARKILQQACRTLAELGGDAFAAAEDPHSMTR
jgi:transposase